MLGETCVFPLIQHMDAGIVQEHFAENEQKMS